MGQLDKKHYSQQSPWYPSQSKASCLVQIQNHWLRTQFCFMSPMKSRSNSPAMNEDSVKRDQRSSSVPDEYNSEIKRTVVSRSRSITRSRSRSRSRRSLSRDRRDRSRSRSRRRARSRSRGGSRGRRYRSRSRSPRRSRSPEENRLHVGDINEDCRKRHLEKIFSKYGPLKEIWLASYAPFYAFVNYESRSDMEYAVKRANGERIAGRRIRVTVAKPRNRGPRNRYDRR